MVIGFLALLPILVVLAAIGMAVLHFTQKDKKSFNFSSVLLSYFYIVSIISLIAVVVGTATVGGALLSDAFGRDFTYRSYNHYLEAERLYVPEDEEEIESTQETEKQILHSQQQEKDRIEAEYRDNLYAGTSALVVGLLFFITHFIGWREVEKRGQHPPVLYKAYMFSQLAIFSVATLIALPIAISQLLGYYLQPADIINDSAPTPGTALSLSVAVLPLWLFFAYKTIKLASANTEDNAVDNTSKSSRKR